MLQNKMGFSIFGFLFSIHALSEKSEKIKDLFL